MRRSRSSSACPASRAPSSAASRSSSRARTRMRRSARCTLALLFIAGTTLGVHLSIGQWLHMTEFILIGLIPFAVLGILLGHLLNVESIGPSLGGITALFAFLGGVWFPITSGILHDI